MEDFVIWLFNVFEEEGIEVLNGNSKIIIGGVDLGLEGVHASEHLSKQLDALLFEPIESQSDHAYVCAGAFPKV